MFHQLNFMTPSAKWPLLGLFISLIFHSTTFCTCCETIQFVWHSLDMQEYCYRSRKFGLTFTGYPRTLLQMFQFCFGFHWMSQNFFLEGQNLLWHPLDVPELCCVYICTNFAACPGTLLQKL